MSSLPTNLSKEQFQTLNTLPTLDQSVLHILGVIDNPNSNNEKIANEVNRDPVICAEILKTINSSACGMPRKVDNVMQAIGLLGTSNLKTLVLSLGVLKMLSKASREIWLHSYTASKLMQGLVSCNELEVASDIGLTTLLHDIGRVALRQINPTAYEQVEALVGSRKMSYCEAEIEMFDISHDIASCWLLELWDLPESIRIPVGYHHQNQVPPQFELETALLQIVDHLDLQARKQPTQKPSPLLMEAVGVDTSTFAELLTYQQERILELDGNSFLNVMENTGTVRLQRFSRKNTMFPGHCTADS